MVVLLGACLLLRDVEEGRWPQGEGGVKGDMLKTQAFGLPWPQCSVRATATDISDAIAMALPRLTPSSAAAKS